METLQSYSFKRPSRSQYTPVVKVLTENPDRIIRLKRGEDFPRDAKIASVQGAVSTQLREAGGGRRPRTFVEDDDNLIVAFWPEGEGPKPRAKRRARQAVAA